MTNQRVSKRTIGRIGNRDRTFPQHDAKPTSAYGTFERNMCGFYIPDKICVVLPFVHLFEDIGKTGIKFEGICLTELISFYIHNQLMENRDSVCC